MPYLGIDAKKDIRLNATSDLDLTSDSTTIKFGADDDVILTHVHNTGLLLNSTNQFQFGDSGTYIHQSADGVLDLVSDTEIEINATTIDMNGAVDISGNATFGGTVNIGTTGSLSNNSGTFLIDANTNLTFRGGVQTFDNADGSTEYMRIDSSGNVGFKAIPNANASNYNNLRLGHSSNIMFQETSGASTSLQISHNAHFDTDNSWEYIITDEASNYYQDSGNHVFRVASSGTSGNDISWTTAMKIDTSGNVGIGTTSPNEKLDVSGNVVVSNGGFYKFGDGDERLYGSSSVGLTFVTNDSERARIDTSGNLLVSKTTADGGVAGFETRTSGETFATASATAPLYAKRLGSGTNDDGDVIVIQNNDGTVGSIGSASVGGLEITGNNSSKSLILTTNFFPGNGAGAKNDNSIDLGISDARWKDLYLSGGAYIGGTGSANLLDDYEEGTFTPPFLIGGSTAGISVAHQEGKYTKIGNICHVIVRINLSNKGSNSGYVTIGLPFASANTSGQGGVVSFPYTFNFGGNTVDNNISGFCQQNSTSFGLFHQASGSSVAGGDLNNNTQFNFTLTYQTT